MLLLDPASALTALATNILLALSASSLDISACIRVSDVVGEGLETVANRVAINGETVEGEGAIDGINEESEVADTNAADQGRHGEAVSDDEERGAVGIVIVTNLSLDNTMDEEGSAMRINEWDAVIRTHSTAKVEKTRGLEAHDVTRSAVVENEVHESQNTVAKDLELDPQVGQVNVTLVGEHEDRARGRGRRGRSRGA